MLHSILLTCCYHMILLFPPLINTEQCNNVLMVVVCSYSTMGSCSSGGRVGRPLIIRVAVHSLSLFVHMTKCPWARHFNPNYSHCVDVVKYVLDKSVKQKQTKKKNKNNMKSPGSSRMLMTHRKLRTEEDTGQDSERHLSCRMVS